MENQNKAWQARRLEKARLRQIEAIKRRLAREACIYCQKAVIYPEGLYLKAGRQAHLICFQEKRRLLNSAFLTREKA